MSDFNTVKEFVLELGFVISSEIPEEEIVIIDDEERGIQVWSSIAKTPCWCSSNSSCDSILRRVLKGWRAFCK